MSNLFWYQREVKRKLKDEKPVDASEDWKPTETEVTETYWDCFNVNKVIRGHWTSPEEFTVMLDDGHEQADDVQKPIWKNGKISGVETKRERAWYMSQIPLKKEDAERLMTGAIEIKVQ